MQGLVSRHKDKQDLKLQAQDLKIQEMVKAEMLRQSTGFSAFGGASGTPDPISATKGIGAYRKMLRDAEVKADLKIKLLATIPGINIQPPDSSPEAMESTLFIRQVIDVMPGSFAHIVRNEMYKEALVTGKHITEPVQAIVETPDFGLVKGLAALKTVRSEDFVNGIETDDYGNIIQFNQDSFGTKSIPIAPDKVLYYAHDGSPANRHGISDFQAAYDPWFLKTNLFKLYTVFCTVNASGLRIGKIPEEDFLKEKDAALARLVAMAEYAAIVMPENQKLEIQIPPGTAGSHFIDGIRELANKEIRKAILFDETINAEGQHTGSYASKKVSQDVVYEAMAAEGYAYCEAVIREQLFKMILRWNGLSHLPTPLCIPQPTAKRDADLVPIITGITAAKTAGAITIEIPEDIQKQMVSKMLDSAGITYDFVEDSSPDNSKPDTKPQEEASLIAANAPKGRQRSDILRIKKDAVKAEEEAKVLVLDTWNGNLPKLIAGINNKLFKADGTWKSKNYGTVRKSMENAILTGGPEMRKTLTDISVTRWEDGSKDADKMLKLSGAVGTNPVVISPTAARSKLSSSVYMTLQKFYGDLSQEMWQILDSALTKGTAPRTVMASMSEFLSDKGFPPGRAATIVNTSLSEAYNGGRMSQFSQLADPLGTTPGGIIGFMFSNPMDNVTTPLCASLDSKFFKVDDPSLPQPPMDYNCRSILIPVFAGEEPWNNGKWETLADSRGYTSGIKPGFGG